MAELRVKISSISDAYWAGYRRGVRDCDEVYYLKTHEDQLESALNIEGIDLNTEDEL